MSNEEKKISNYGRTTPLPSISASIQILKEGRTTPPPPPPSPSPSPSNQDTPPPSPPVKPSTDG